MTSAGVSHAQSRTGSLAMRLSGRLGAVRQGWKGRPKPCASARVASSLTSSTSAPRAFSA